jgi:hypothetical protein
VFNLAQIKADTLSVILKDVGCPMKTNETHSFFRLVTTESAEVFLTPILGVVAFLVVPELALA